MKKTTLIFFLLASVVTSLASCGPSCEVCQPEVMGVKGPEQEFCGDELEAAKKTPNIVCHKK